MSTNPSHILIARNSRGLNAPAAALSSPTETHAAASGIFRSSGSAQWFLEDWEEEEIDSELSADEEEQGIDIDQTFTKNCKLPGTVKVIVGSSTFWCVTRPTFFHNCSHQFLSGRIKRFSSLHLLSLRRP
jgi:hypothetical protein